MATKFREIVSSDDDMVATELIQWAGLSEVFRRHDLSCINFVGEVAECCRHIDIDREEWGGDMPGHSGTWHVVRTNDARKLKQELRSALAGVLWAKRHEILREKLRERRAARAEERRRRRICPKNHRHMCTHHVWDDLMGSSYEYHLELTRETPARYRLWEKRHGYWRPTSLYAAFDEDLVAISRSLLRRLFGTLPPEDGFLEPGEVLTAADLKLPE